MARFLLLPVVDAFLLTQAKWSVNMKRTLTVVALVGMLGAASLTPAFAGWWGGERGCGPRSGAGCGKGPCSSREGDGNLDQARQVFRDQSQELRQLLFAKKGAYRDLMQQDAPNKDEAAKLWSEIFDLQSKIQQMASASGITRGNGNAPCGGPCDSERRADAQDQPGCYGGRGGCGRGCDGPR